MVMDSMRLSPRTFMRIVLKSAHIAKNICTIKQTLKS